MNKRTASIFERGNINRYMMVEPEKIDTLKKMGMVEPLNVANGTVWQTTEHRTLEHVRQVLRAERLMHTCDGHVTQAELQLVITVECSHHGKRTEVVTLPIDVLRMVSDEHVPADIDLSQFINPHLN